jgi:hypothetical protein
MCQQLEMSCSATHSGPPKQPEDATPRTQNTDREVEVTTHTAQHMELMHGMARMLCYKGMQLNMKVNGLKALCKPYFIPLLHAYIMESASERHSNNASPYTSSGLPFDKGYFVACFVVVGAGVCDSVCRWCHGRGGGGASASPHSKQLTRSAWKPAILMTVDSRHGTQTQ